MSFDEMMNEVHRIESGIRTTGPVCSPTRRNMLTGANQTGRTLPTYEEALQRYGLQAQQPQRAQPSPQSEPAFDYAAHQADYMQQLFGSDQVPQYEYQER